MKTTKNKAREYVCEIQGESIARAAFPTPSTVCHDTGFRAIGLLFTAEGRK